MIILSAVAGFAAVLVMRKGFGKLPKGAKVAAVVVTAFVVMLAFPNIFDDPMSIVNAGRSWLASMGLSIIGFVVGVGAGFWVP